MAPQQQGGYPCSNDTSNQRLDLTKGSIKRIKESNLVSSQHSSSCPSLPTLVQPTAAPVPGPSAFASHSKQCMAAPIGLAEVAEASDVEPTQDVHPLLSLSRAYTAPAAIGPTSVTRASFFPAPRACPTGLDRFGSFAAMLVFGHHHPDELAAVAAGRDGPEHSASHLQSAASDIYDHLVVQGNSHSWLSLDDLVISGDGSEEGEGDDSDASLHYMAVEVAAGVKASIPHHLGHHLEQHPQPWSSDTSLAGSCYGDIPNEASGGGCSSSGLGSSSSASSSSWRLGGCCSSSSGCGASPDTSACSWRFGSSSCQAEDSMLSEEPSLPELPLPLGGGGANNSAYLVPPMATTLTTAPSVAAAAAHKRHLVPAGHQKPPARRHGPSGLGLANRAMSPPAQDVYQLAAASWLDRAALQLKSLLVCGTPRAAAAFPGQA
jgi:hypothetical protein